jgi:hypothetical protein
LKFNPWNFQSKNDSSYNLQCVVKKKEPKFFNRKKGRKKEKRKKEKQHNQKAQNIINDLGSFLNSKGFKTISNPSDPETTRG